MRDPDICATTRTREFDPCSGYLIIRDTEKLVALSTPDFHPAQPPVGKSLVGLCICSIVVYFKEIIYSSVLFFSSRSASGISPRAPAIRYSSEAHFPRSISLHRSEQNGLDPFPFQGASFLHIGQVIVRSFMFLSGVGLVVFLFTSEHTLSALRSIHEQKAWARRGIRPGSKRCPKFRSRSFPLLHFFHTAGWISLRVWTGNFACLARSCLAILPTFQRRVIALYSNRSTSSMTSLNSPPWLFEREKSSSLRVWISRSSHRS